ncbi:glycerophosphodiester phosphodiesterase [Clostridium magnum]|uniref:Glycerophosphoryl diester phosphodiesterase n=1 Tax=Clostridium magnum DSM 2767 TaxID=1121326 RepID=A0A162T6U1_9CLOT|nr:glycerophosphodiester phosphodiesterase family protein [Clostridium magnum]KZL92307.1 glycerophosphoryl diester phosphodiesterase [Clostridium magnum DSM 2767]SHH13974.1 glycerophosphoryl diester phosphodiesterase [Clostridium magnum DSM 2767]
MKRGINKIAIFISMVCIFCVISLDYNYKEVKSEEATPKVIAHRGYSIDAPENTIKAIMLAAENKSDYAEFDVQQTKDGIPVLLHDKSLKRTAGIDKELSQVNYSEIKDIDIGNVYSKRYKGETIPTLEQVMKITKGKIKLDIELKMYKNNYDLPNKVVKLIEENDFLDNSIVTSFDYNALVKVKTLNPKIRTSLIVSSRFNYKPSKWIDIYSLKDSIITESLIYDIHRDKKQIHVWTLNSKYDMAKFIRLGVDGIITDNPQAYTDAIDEGVEEYPIQ